MIKTSTRSVPCFVVYILEDQQWCRIIPPGRELEYLQRGNSKMTSRFSKSHGPDSAAVIVFRGTVEKRARASPCQFQREASVFQ